MAKRAKKISNKWTEQTRKFFKDFLDETGFPDLNRTGERRSKFQYPERLIMFIAVLSVKMKNKTYIQIHKMATKYWDLIAKNLSLKPISERHSSEIA